MSRLLLTASFAVLLACFAWWRTDAVVESESKNQEEMPTLATASGASSPGAASAPSLGSLGKPAHEAAQGRYTAVLPAGIEAGASIESLRALLQWAVWCQSRQPEPLEPVRQACSRVEKLGRSATQKVHSAAKQGDAEARQLLSDLAQLRRQREQRPLDDDMLAGALVEWVHQSQTELGR
jgi:hypothetical protein